jgi:SPP1 gp7 family putative phage head morphogenesis protein
MKNSEYWKKRFELLEQSQNQQGLQCYADIEKQYRQAQKQIEGQIAAWYQRFAKNNGITLADARKMLTSKELEELKWDINQYIQYGEENAINGTWVKQLENASARYHISRLEALKLQTQQSIEAMFGNQLDSIDSAMRNIYTSGYYRTAFEIQKGVGVGWDFATLDEKQISKIINKPWAVDGKNFSERIWGNRQKLVNELNTELTRNIILGQDPQKAIDAIARKMNTSKTAAGRLVMTEEAFFSSAAQKDCFAELDVEQFEIVATLDSHTSDICREMDGKHFPMSQWEVGVTAPPFHVWCRSTTVPFFDDEFDSVGERAARGEDGKTYYVPSDMTYKQWQQSFVEGDKTGLQEATPDDTIKAKKEVKQVAEELKAENFPSAFTAKSEMKNTQALVDYVNSLEGADANTVALFNRMGKLESVESNSIPFKISHGKNHAVSTSSYTFTGELAEVKLTIPKLQGENLAGQVNTTLHEEMHLMDLYGRSNVKKSGNWFSTSRQSLVDKFKQTSSDMSDDVKKLFAEHDEKWKEVSSAVRSKYNSQITALNDAMMNRTFQGTYSDYKKQYNKLQSLLESERDYECRNIMGGGIGNLQDIYDALSGGVFRDTGVVKYGHGGKYYQSVNSRVHETIANYAALSVTRPDLIELLRADKPELVAELDAVIVELLKKAGGE